MVCKYNFSLNTKTVFGEIYSLDLGAGNKENKPGIFMPFLYGTSRCTKSRWRKNSNKWKRNKRIRLSPFAIPSGIMEVGKVQSQFPLFHLADFTSYIQKGGSVILAPPWASLESDLCLFQLLGYLGTKWLGIRWTFFSDSRKVLVSVLVQSSFNGAAHPFLGNSLASLY